MIAPEHAANTNVTLERGSWDSTYCAVWN